MSSVVSIVLLEYIHIIQHIVQFFKGKCVFFCEIFKKIM